MCIIAYKPAGERFPTKNQFKTMFRRNPDGAGFMTIVNNQVVIKKGFMTYSEFQNALTPFKKDHGIEKPFVFHFRIATHGGINEAMTQPFPMTSSTKKLRALESACDVGIAHNGIIPICDDAKTISDSALFIKLYITRLYDSKHGFDDITLNIVEACIDSRMLILESSGEVHILGYGWKKENGLYFSNTSYQDYSKPTKAKTTASCNYASWDYDTVSDNYCDGYCSACPHLSQCWDTSAPYDIGINSI